MGLPTAPPLGLPPPCRLPMKLTLTLWLTPRLLRRELCCGEPLSASGSCRRRRPVPSIETKAAKRPRSDPGRSLPCNAGGGLGEVPASSGGEGVPGDSDVAGGLGILGGGESGEEGCSSGEGACSLGGSGSSTARGRASALGIVWPMRTKSSMHMQCPQGKATRGDLRSKQIGHSAVRNKRLPQTIGLPHRHVGHAMMPPSCRVESCAVDAMLIQLHPRLPPRTVKMQGGGALANDSSDKV